MVSVQQQAKKARKRVIAMTCVGDAVAVFAYAGVSSLLPQVVPDRHGPIVSLCAGMCCMRPEA